MTVVSKLVPTAGVLVLAVYFTVAQGHPLALALLYNALAATAFVSICVGIRWRQPSAKLPWQLAAVGFALQWLGDSLFTYFELFTDTGAPFPSWADAAYLGGYGFLGLSFLAFTRARMPGRDRTALIDSLLLGCAAGLVAWLLFFDDYLADETLAFGALATGLAYPLFDVLLVALVARLAFTGALRTTPVGIIALSTCGWVVADTIYGVQATAGTYETGSIVDLGWMAAYVLWSRAALHPRMARLTDPVQETRPTLSRRRLGLLAAASLLAPLVLVVKSSWGDVDNLAVIGGAAAAMFNLVVLRLAGLASALGEAAMRDPLTQLSNRTSLMARIERALQHAGRGPAAHVAVLFIDLDRFKLLNDTMGHNAGDAVLLAVARRLESAVGARDTVARLGGDEFVVLCEGVNGAAGAVDIVERIEHALADPVEVAGVTVMLTASIGATVTDSPATDPERLVQDADAAMYRAKQRSQSRFEVVDERVRRSVLFEEALVADIERGVAAGEFVPFFQPIVDLESGRLAGVEALARWQHPERGLLLPADFLAAAEASGLIVPLGESLLRRAAAEFVTLRATHGDQLRLFVNLSQRQLEQFDLSSTMLAILDEHGIEPSSLVVEVNEVISGAAMAQSAELVRLLDAGVEAWLDDVGAGNRNVLERPPVQVTGLKIDRHFISRGVDDAAVAGVVAVALLRGQRVVAEGVETAEDIAALRALGVALAQGYHLAVPAPAAVLMDGASAHQATTTT